jgi:NAD(P)H-quinone oxidoreductase subunit 5
MQLGSFLLLILLKQFFSNLSEKAIIRIVANTTFSSILLIITLIAFIIFNADHHYIIDLGTWFKDEDSKYEIIFVIDSLALTYSLFSTIIISLVVIFSRRYLHREKGFYRFYTFMTLFIFGVNLISFAGTMELIIIGWEFVGLSSILLVAFFNYRQTPVKNALWVFVNYRICDIGLFAAVLVMHAFAHNSDFQPLFSANWLGISQNQAPIILGFLILFGAIGKSALFPCSGWLAKAMEGPTPSSAIFYGAISIHFGPFLLLRCADLIAASPLLSSSIITIGLITALGARLIARSQTDAKSMISYEAVMQIGLIVVEIGLGWNVIAVIHIVGHSSFRTLQMLRAPSLIHDLRNIEQMLGHNLTKNNINKRASHFDYLLYHLASEKCCMDNFVKDFVIGNILLPFHKIDQLEKKWSNWISNNRNS